MAVALSGGPDSIFLLYQLVGMASRYNLEIYALHVDHKLRGESSAEAVELQHALKKLNISFHILTWEHPPISTRVQEKAREARYKLMSEFCIKNKISYLCTAHHADDNRETFFMRLKKQSGLDGLCGITAVSNRGGMQLLRPLLHTPKEEILSWLHKHHIFYLQDSSNKNEKFERVRLRQFLSEPHAADFLPSPQEAAVVMNKLRQQQEALTFAVDYFAELTVKKEPLAYTLSPTFHELPNALKSNILRNIIKDLAGERPYPLKEKSINLALQKLSLDKPFVLGNCYFKNKKEGWLISYKPHPNNARHPLQTIDQL